MTTAITTDDAYVVDMSRAKDILARLTGIVDSLDGLHTYAETTRNNLPEDKSRNRILSQFSKTQQYASFLIRDLGVEIEAQYFAARGQQV